VQEFARSGPVAVLVVLVEGSCEQSRSVHRGMVPCSTAISARGRPRQRSLAGSEGTSVQSRSRHGRQK
jgi:hypothetical protein